MATIATPAPQVNALLMASVREALAIRDSALAEIRAASPAWLNTAAGRDRVADVAAQNRWIETAAERSGMTPQALIAAAEMTADGDSPDAPACLLDAWPEGWNEEIDGFNWELGPEPDDAAWHAEQNADGHTADETPLEVLVAPAEAGPFAFVCMDPRGPKGRIYCGLIFDSAGAAHAWVDRTSDDVRRDLIHNGYRVQPLA